MIAPEVVSWRKMIGTLQNATFWTPRLLGEPVKSICLVDCFSWPAERCADRKRMNELALGRR